MAKDWLEVEHPTYTSRKEVWEKMERRFFGGDEVLSELVPFRWEVGTDGLKSLVARKDQATYINFPDLFARTMVGHLMRHAPPPEEGLDFGSLGSAAAREGDETQISRAELVYFNADGIGNDGSQWENFWGRVEALAAATGHRWLFVDASAEQPKSLQDEIDGKRPFLVDYSPLAVTNWSFSDGRLDWAVIITSRRQPKIVGDKMEGNDAEKMYLLLVREGYENLGDEFVGGGWWLYDSDREIAVDTAGVEQVGDWEKTDGEIPMWVHFYERVDLPNRMSRPGIHEISQSAVAYMNLSSAADFDAWDAASSILYMIGVDAEGFKLMADKTKDGAKVVPVPANKRTGDNPVIFDGSTGAVVSGVFETRLERKRDEAFEAAAMEASGEPGSSGTSKRAGFADIRAPRLALMASEMEASQNIAIRFLELRFGEVPTGEVTWRRDFDLLQLVDTLRECFEVAALAEVESETLTVNGIMSMVRKKGLAKNDAEEELIEAEIRASFQARQRQAEQGEAAVSEEEEINRTIEAALAIDAAGADADVGGIEPALVEGVTT